MYWDRSKGSSKAEIQSDRVQACSRMFEGRESNLGRG